MLARLVPSLFFGLVLSCSGTSGDATTAADDDSSAVITCEAGADTYVAELEKAGRASIFRFVLKESVPAPPARGRNTWSVRVLDGTGAPVSGAQLSVEATMPAHGHSSPTLPTVTEEGGAYVVGPISLFMPGLWQVTVMADSPSGRDSAVFSFCVAG